MKVLFVLENYFPHVGGVEVVFKNLAEGLVKEGKDVSIITHRLKGTKKFEVINGVKVFRVSCFHSRYLFTFFSIPKVLRLAREADIIHTTTFNGAFPAWLGAKLLRKPNVITIHEVWVGRWKELTEMNWFSAKLHSLLEGMIYFLRFDKYVCVSYSTKKQLLKTGVKGERISVVYNGVDYEHWNPKKYSGSGVKKRLRLKENFVYLFSGRPGVSKGLEYLLKAVPLISKRIGKARLLAIVSKDPAYRKQYKKMLKLIKKLGVEDKVIIHDPVGYEELPNYVKAADCIVVPSLSEGFGFAAAEACAMGEAVVVSNTASLPEVVSGRYVLVKPKDVGGIAKGVVDVYKKKFKRKKLNKFWLRENIRGYLKVYKNMLK